MSEGKGRCRHGEFNLKEGCPQCIEEARSKKVFGKSAEDYANETSDRLQVEHVKSMYKRHVDEGLLPQEVETNIVKVKYWSDSKGEIAGKDYCYFTAWPLVVGEYVMVPVRGRQQKAIVTEINVPESEIQAFRDAVKTISANEPVFVDKKPLLGSNEPEQYELTSPPDLDELDEETGWEDSHQENEEFDSESTVGQTAIVKVDPGKEPAVQKLLDEIMRIHQWASQLEVATLEEALTATNDLSIMASLKKSVEEKRREYVGPLNQHVKAVNDAFKLLTGPLSQADKLVRDKVLAFNQEQQRRQREAEEINRAKEELARREAALNHGEFTVDTTPVPVVEAPGVVRSGMGTAGMVDNWQVEVVDADQIPRQYMVPDMPVLNTIAKKYHDSRQIPGVKFVNKPTLRVSSRKEG